MYNLFRFILESNGWTPYFLYSLLELIVQCLYASINFSNYILLHESWYLVTFVKITILLFTLINISSIVCNLKSL